MSWYWESMPKSNFSKPILIYNSTVSHTWSGTLFDGSTQRHVIYNRNMVVAGRLATHEVHYVCPLGQNQTWGHSKLRSSLNQYKRDRGLLQARGVQGLYWLMSTAKAIVKMTMSETSRSSQQHKRSFRIHAHRCFVLNISPSLSILYNAF
jgi:hypothetical protein